MKYKLVIFDMDGTILNTLEDLTDSVNYSMEKMNFPKHTLDEVRNFVGNGIAKLIERSLPKNTEKSIYEVALSEFTKYYKTHSAIKTAPYDGIKELLKKLKENGVITAVNTNKIESAAIDLCDDYFPALFDIIIGNKKDVPPKPAPDGIYEIIEKASELKNEKIQKKDIAYVGDSDVDLKTGINAGVNVIGVNWGFRGKDFLLKNGAQTVVMNTQELFDLCK
jgi:phosphoglycolate phosphatase